MKKLHTMLTVLTVAMLLFASCDNDNDQEEYVTIDEKIRIPYYMLQREVDDEYMYFQTQRFTYADHNLLSYEIVDVVGEPTLLSVTKIPVYDTSRKVTFFSMKFEVDITTKYWMENYWKFQNNRTFFLTLTMRLKLEKNYELY